MEPRPRIRLPLTPTDRLIEVAGLLLLLALWAAVALAYPGLPDRIPSHFDASGRPDDYGPKATILLLPVIGTVLFSGMTALNRFPHLFNYLRPITPENAKQEYTSYTRMIRITKLVVLLIFNGIVQLTLRTVAGRSAGLGPWFLPLALGLIALPVLYFLLRRGPSEP